MASNNNAPALSSKLCFGVAAVLLFSPLRCFQKNPPRDCPFEDRGL